MLDLGAYLLAGAAIATLAIVAWLISIAKNDVSIVDVLWAPMFLIVTLGYMATADSIGPRAAMVLVLVAVWALRLAGHIAWRNHGQPEDRRYRAIRRNNEPNFAVKSLYIVFGLQAFLAWFIALPLVVAVTAPNSLTPIDYVGTALFLVGFSFEAVGDWQLAHFKSDPTNHGRVLNRGLWAYTRHPNYFGEFVIWWGFFLIAVSAGGWWTVTSPLLMTFLLLKVSGVAMLERDISERRPDYETYVRSTNAFFPGLPRRMKRMETTS
jgi:steroid 5-alpha reductase family enzyme